MFYVVIEFEYWKMHEQHASPIIAPANINCNACTALLEISAFLIRQAPDSHKRTGGKIIVIKMNLFARS